MRDYSKVYPQFWIGETGRAIKKHGVHALLLAQYLISSPHANMVGIYYLPVAFIAHETGMSSEDVLKALSSLIEVQFCSYDEDKEYVWVHNMAFFQVERQLKANDNRVTNVNSYFKKLPELKFLSQYYEKYRLPLLLEDRKNLGTPFEGGSKPLRSQEQEQEKEKKQEEEKEQEISAWSKSDPALAKVDSHIISLSVDSKAVGQIFVPLKDNKKFQITDEMIAKWQIAYPNINLLQVLLQIQEWNLANPKKRKTGAGILRHINLWLAREEEKYKDGKIKVKNHTDQKFSLYSINQSVANEWLQNSNIEEIGECH